MPTSIFPLSVQGPKKKLTKQERKKLEAERAEQARIEAEEAAIKAAEEERLARIAEMKALKEKEKRENLEHGFRCEQLQVSCERIASLIRFNFELAMEEKKQREVLFIETQKKIRLLFCCCYSGNSI